MDGKGFEGSGRLFESVSVENSKRLEYLYYEFFHFDDCEIKPSSPVYAYAAAARDAYKTLKELLNGDALELLEGYCEVQSVLEDSRNIKTFMRTLRFCMWLMVEEGTDFFGALGMTELGKKIDESIE
ncbi:MAG: hypothetical protein LBH95_04970 [Oscillospiraceae bacterium]|nr:hypothetical protein [Oscillospiraceae bacterium]